MPDTHKIYLLTVINSRFNVVTRTSPKSVRTWAWQPTFEALELSLVTNIDFYAESGYYDYAVIEEVEAGSIGPHKVMRWYEFLYSTETGTHTLQPLRDVPEFATHAYTWSIG